MILPPPHPSGSKKLNIRAFIWGIVGFFTSAGFVRILKKAEDWSLFQDSEGTSTTTETNNISYESPDNQLFGARRMRAGHHHGGATPTSHKTVCYFFFWGRGGQEGWFFKKKIWLHQMSASNECTNTVFMTQKCIFDNLISVFFRTYRV